MKKNIEILGILVAFLSLLSLSSFGHAQAQSAPTDFSFDNFAGTYYLDRNYKGVATLTVEEDMVVEFPLNSNLYGIQRSIPTSYQGHNLDLKIISVTDAAGNPLPYKTHNDGQGNEVIATGDPSIILSGLQTYDIKYQTSGVVSLNANSDEFLLDVNGRGWQETFGSVKAFIQLAKSFTANLHAKPACYIGYNNEQLNTCSVTYQSETTGLFAALITATTTKPLAAHQGLVIRLDFKKGTFTQKQNSNNNKVFISAALAIVFFAAGSVVVYRYRHTSRKLSKD